ncbi:hypothetical protein PENSPDRAFT_757056 [Peniophora sp. CONT]|nr:hypothetical protein PENSPDRAFT_757056 [Peniophora sp. CONT]
MSRLDQFQQGNSSYGTGPNQASGMPAASHPSYDYQNQNQQYQAQQFGQPLDQPWQAQPDVWDSNAHQPPVTLGANGYSLARACGDNPETMLKARVPRTSRVASGWHQNTLARVKPFASSVIQSQHQVPSQWNHRGLAFVAGLQPDNGWSEQPNGRPFVHLQPAPALIDVMAGNLQSTSKVPDDFFHSSKHAPASASYAHHVRNGIMLSSAQVQAALHSLQIAEKYFDLHAKLSADERFKAEYPRTHAIFSAAENDRILANSLAYAMRVLGSTALN